MPKGVPAIAPFLTTTYLIARFVDGHQIIRFVTIGTGAAGGGSHVSPCIPALRAARPAGNLAPIPKSTTTGHHFSLVIFMMCIEMIFFLFKFICRTMQCIGIVLFMSLANERWRYTVTPSLIGWAYTQMDS